MIPSPVYPPQADQSVRQEIDPSGRRQVMGMTLIELLIVILLVMTLAGLATANFIQSYQARNVEHFAKDLAAYIRYVQFKAIEDGSIHQLKLDSESGLLETFAQEKKDIDFQKVTTPFSKRFQKQDQYTIRFRKGKEIYFYPDGNVTPNQLLLLENEQEKASVEIKNRIGAFKVTVND